MIENKRNWASLTWLFALMICMAILNPACNTKEVTNIANSQSKGQILLAMDQYFAGDSLSIPVSIESPIRGTETHLVWSGRYGDKIFAKPAQSQIEFAIPDELMKVSGKVNLSLHYQGKDLHKRMIEIIPHIADSKMEAYLGPKSILASSSQSSEIIVIPTDRFGNPVTDNTEVAFMLQYPDLRTEKVDTRTRNLISFVDLPSQVKEGRILIAANAGNAFTAEQALEIIPGLPEAITVYVEKWVPFADGRNIIGLKTNPIADQSGNIVEDGTHCIFTLEHETKIKAQYNAYTIGGIATAQVQNPRVPGKWLIYAQTSNRVRSNIVELDFISNILDIPVTYDPQENQLIIGPVFGQLNQLAADGIPVKIRLIIDDAIYILNKVLEDGTTTLYMDDYAMTGNEMDYEIFIGGKEVEGSLKINE